MEQNIEIVDLPVKKIQIIAKRKKIKKKKSRKKNINIKDNIEEIVLTTDETREKELKLRNVALKKKIKEIKDKQKVATLHLENSAGLLGALGENIFESKSKKLEESKDSELKDQKDKILRKKINLAELRQKKKILKERRLKEEQERLEKEEEENQAQLEKEKKEKARKANQKLQEIIKVVSQRRIEHDKIKKKELETKQKQKEQSYTKDISGVVALLHFVKPQKIEQVKITNIKKFLIEYLPYTGNTTENKAIKVERTKISNAITSLYNNRGMVKYVSSRTYYEKTHEKRFELRRGNS